jgi:hypothetical protein
MRCDVGRRTCVNGCEGVVKGSFNNRLLQCYLVLQINSKLLCVGVRLCHALLCVLFLFVSNFLGEFSVVIRDRKELWLRSNQFM